MIKTVGMVALGCAKNRVDSESMLGTLAQAGYAVVRDPGQADLVIVNTCGFIESAKEEAISVLLEYAGLREETGRPRHILATGCLVQRYSAELEAEMPEIDGFLGVAEYGRLLETIAEIDSGARPLHCGEGELFLETPRVLTTPKWSAYVKISDGCDNRCSYCAIPLIRGRYRSRPYDDIVRECRSLAEGGARELTLIAQDTSRYGVDFPGHRPVLARLLGDISRIDAVKWLRVLYCYPDTANEELLDAIAALPKVCKYLDLPLQHIDGPLLHAMNRRGSPELIREVLRMCRERGIAVRTTFIVGFPGETEEQFGELLAFVKEARFARMGAFTYSPEEGTPAADMPGQIPEEVKQDRYDRLMRAQQAVSRSVLRERLGTVDEVLVEKRDARGRYIGRSMLEAPDVDGVVRFSARREIAPGSFVPVRMLAARAYDLVGEAVE